MNKESEPHQISRASRIGRVGLEDLGLRRMAASFGVHVHVMRQRVRWREDRGDVPGWVLVTLMTAGLVVALWGAAGPRLVQIFNDAVDNVVGGP